MFTNGPRLSWRTHASTSFCRIQVTCTNRVGHEKKSRDHWPNSIFPWCVFSSLPMNPKGTLGFVLVGPSLCFTWFPPLWFKKLNSLLYVYRSSLSFFTFEWFFTRYTGLCAEYSFPYFFTMLLIRMLTFGMWFTADWYTYVYISSQLNDFTRYGMCRIYIHHIFQTCFV